MPELDEFQPPRDELVRRRWIAGRTVDWVRKADAIMVEHGSVVGRTSYTTRDRARWRARYLISMMVDLRLHARWELREHVERKADGYVWAVEYLGDRG